MDSHVPSDDLSGFWTNEKHVNFLNRMEASFVRTMLENGDRSMLKCANAPLNRYVPDSSESTRELGHRRNRRKNTHLYFPEVTESNTNAVRTNGRKTRRRSTRRHDVSQDQVSQTSMNLIQPFDDHRHLWVLLEVIIEINATWTF